jgi:hypothetical protein
MAFSKTTCLTNLAYDIKSTLHQIIQLLCATLSNIVCIESNIKESISKSMQFDVFSEYMKNKFNTLSMNCLNA